MRGEIRNIEKNDKEVLFHFFRQAYQFNPRLTEPDYFEWQFRLSPFNDGKTYTILGYWNKNELRSILGYLPVEFLWKGKIYKGCCSMNWYSLDRDLSGLKLLSHMRRLFGNCFLIGLSEDSVDILSRYKMAIQTDMPRWTVVVDADACWKLFGETGGTNVRPMMKRSMDTFKRHVLNSSTERKSCHIERLEKFPENVEFNVSDSDKPYAQIRRTGRYLNWRYVYIPRHQYMLISNGSNQYLIYRIEKIRYTVFFVLRILELAFVDDDHIKAALTYIFDNEIGRRNIILVDFFCCSEKIGGRLERYGFVMKYKDYRLPHLFRPIKKNGSIKIAFDLPLLRESPTAINFNEWYITKGDSDLDRFKL